MLTLQRSDIFLSPLNLLEDIFNYRFSGDE